MRGPTLVAAVAISLGLLPAVAKADGTRNDRLCRQGICVDKFREILIKAGLRLTKQRLAILKALEHDRGPVSAQELHAKLKKVDLASVYRNLELLKEAGVVFAETRGRENHYYFDKKQHHHITCKECGLIECIPCKHDYSPLRGFKKITHQVILEGLCNNCLKIS